MIDAAQAVLLLVIVILTTLLVILGIQVFFILKELRYTISKANKVLDDTSHITETVSAPISHLSSILTGVKAGTVLAGLIKKHTEEKDE